MFSAAGCLFFTPQSVHQEDTAGPGEGEEVQQDLPVKRKLDLSSDEVETGELGRLLLSRALTLGRLGTPWSPADLLSRLLSSEIRMQLNHCGLGAAPTQACSA